MGWIINTSLINVKTGNHPVPGDNSVLIQLVDPDGEFPVSKHSFKEIHQFKFFDLEEDSNDEGNKFSDEQASQIAVILQKAVEEDSNVVVHCHAGICRSGAVVEVGVILGLEDLNVCRQPNCLVKKKLLQAIGFYY